MMFKGDGPTNKGRLWYQQFFNPIAHAGDYRNRVKGRHVTTDNRSEEEMANEAERRARKDYA